MPGAVVWRVLPQTASTEIVLMRKTTRIAALALVVLTFAACSGAAATPPASSGPTPAPPTAVAPGPGGALDGHTYLGRRITGHDLADVTRLRLRFDGGNIGGSGGCNTFGGAFTLTDSVIGTNQVSMTEMACDQQWMTQDDWFSAFISGAKATLDGATLRLEKDGVVVELEDEQVANPDRPLQGTRWVLATILGEGGVASSVPGDVVASLTIKAGQAEIQFGCNSGGGPVTVGDGKLEFGALMMTKMACIGAGAEVEGVMASILAGTVAYAIDGGQLTLTQGAAGLVFTAEGEEG